MTAASRCVVMIGTCLVIAGCRTGMNYVSVGAPRYVGRPLVVSSAPRVQPETLRVVSFNIQLAERIDSAIALLTSDASLRGADVVLLQEMDVEATERVATALNMSYVYYPAIHYFKTRRQFGNAVLSRWPIEDDRKVILPHRSRFGGTHRTATAATLRVGAIRVRVYSAHLGTVADLGPGGRRDQLRQILDDAAPYPMVIVGGDMNSGTVGRSAREAGYLWPTEDGPPTARLGVRYDHIFLKGLTSPERGAAGTVTDVRGSSDHRPVWAVVSLRA